MGSLAVLFLQMCQSATGWFLSVWCVHNVPLCTSVLTSVLSPPQRNTWRVTLAAPQRPSCRRTLACISCSVKRATPAAPSPASRPASRLWRARERSSAPKPIKDRSHRALPALSAFPFLPPQKGRSRGGTPPLIRYKDSLNRTAGGFGCC